MALAFGEALFILIVVIVVNLLGTLIYLGLFFEAVYTRGNNNPNARRFDRSKKGAILFALKRIGEDVGMIGAYSGAGIVLFAMLSGFYYSADNLDTWLARSRVKSNPNKSRI